VNQWFDSRWGKEVHGLNLFLEIQRMTIAMMARAFVGPELAGQEQERFIDILLELDVEDRLTHLSRYIKARLPSGKKETEKLWAELVAIIENLVERRKKDGNQENDFFNFLTNEFTSDGTTDYNHITKVVFASVTAGSTNAFATAGWSLVFISHDKKLREDVLNDAKEYHALLQEGKDTSQLLMNGTLNTTSLINETLRIVFDSVIMRYVLNDIDFEQEFAVPADWCLLMPFSLIMQNKDIYHDPAQFDPKRFLTEGKGTCENLVFGAGRHPCTGAKLALIQVKTVLYNLLARYDIQISDTLQELIPAHQYAGVFRPARPCFVNLQRKE